MTPDSGQWFVLNHIRTSVSRTATPAYAVDRYNETAGDKRLELFAPTFTQMVERNGKLIPKDVPLTYHYVFVRGTLDDVKRLCALSNGFSFVLSHNESFRYLTVTEEAMTQFRIIARAYGNTLPCLALDGIDLEEGDKVEVIGGEFSGLSGTYMPKKGAKSGTIYIAVSAKLATVVYNISTDYIRVTEFAKGSKRPYDLIESFLPRLYRAVALYAAGAVLPTQLLSQLIVFTRRMGSVRLDNNKLDAKLSILLKAATRILGDLDGLEQAERRYRKRSAAITNPWTLSLADYLDGALLPDPALLDRARSRVAALPADTAPRRAFLEVLGG